MPRNVQCNATDETTGLTVNPCRNLEGKAIPFHFVLNDCQNQKARGRDRMMSAFPGIYFRNFPTGRVAKKLLPPEGSSGKGPRRTGSSPARTGGPKSAKGGWRSFVWPI